MAIVAMAGPLANVVLAVRIRGSSANCLGVAGGIATLGGSGTLSVDPAEPGLGDLQPVPSAAPGRGRVVLSMLPNALAKPFAKLERFGFLVLLGIIFLLPMLGRSLEVDLNIFRWFVAIPLAWLMPIFRVIAGAP